MNLYYSLSISEIFLIFLQTLSFYIIPIVVGRGIIVGIPTFLRTVFKRERKQHSEKQLLSHSLLSLFLYFAIGLLSIFLSTLISQYITNNFFQEFTTKEALISTIIALFTLSISIQFFTPFHFPKIHIKHILSGIFLVLTAGIALSVLLFRSPYPLNWDLYEHQTLVNQITDGNFHFFTSNISDTFGFNSYPPLFHLNMAISQWGFHLLPHQILFYWQIIQGIHLIIVGSLSFSLSWIITKKYLPSIFSGVIGILVFDSVISFTNIFLLPQTLTATLFIGLSCYVFVKRDSLSFIQVLLSAITLFLMHYVIGSLAAMILIGILFVLKYPQTSDKLLRHFPVLELGMVIAIVAVILSQFIQLNSINNGEAEAYIFSFLEVSSFQKQIYGYALLVFLPLGIFHSIKSNSLFTRIALYLLFGLVAILISHFPYVLKFFVIGRFFVNLFVALGIWSIVEKIHYKFIQYLTVIPIVITFTALLIINSLYWKQGLFSRQLLSHISPEELQSFELVKEKLPQNAFIISDPTTQYLIEGLTGINSAGGVFASEIFRKDIYSTLELKNGTDQITSLQLIRDKVIDTSASPRYLVLSGRTFLWLSSAEKDRLSYSFNIWSPKMLSDNNKAFINNLVQTSNYQIVLATPEIAVLQFPTR